MCADVADTVHDITDKLLILQTRSSKKLLKTRVFTLKMIRYAQGHAQCPETLFLLNMAYTSEQRKFEVIRVIGDDLACLQTFELL